jgi:hypothetical protein
MAPNLRRRTSALQLCLPLHEQLDLVLQVNVLCCVGLCTCHSPTKGIRSIGGCYDELSEASRWCKRCVDGAVSGTRREGCHDMGRVASAIEHL